MSYTLDLLYCGQIFTLDVRYDSTTAKTWEAPLHCYLLEPLLQSTNIV